MKHSPYAVPAIAYTLNIYQLVCNIGIQRGRGYVTEACGENDR